MRMPSPGFTEEYGHENVDMAVDAESYSRLYQPPMPNQAGYKRLTSPTEYANSNLLVTYQAILFNHGWSTSGQDTGVDQ